MKLSIDPVPKPRMTRADRWKQRPAVMRYWAYCDKLREEVGVYEVPPTLSLVFNVPMPKSWSKKKKLEMEGKPHQQKPDIDNYEKAFLDALCEDDSYVYALRGEKYWATSGSIEVETLLTTTRN